MKMGGDNILNNISEVVVVLSKSRQVEAHHDLDHSLLCKVCIICGSNINLSTSTSMNGPWPRLRVKRLCGPSLFQHLGLPLTGHSGWWLCTSCENNLQQLRVLQKQMAKLKFKIEGIISLLKLKMKPPLKRGDKHFEKSSNAVAAAGGAAAGELCHITREYKSAAATPILSTSTPTHFNLDHRVDMDLNGGITVKDENKDDLKQIILNFEDTLEFVSVVESEEQDGLGESCNVEMDSNLGMEERVESDETYLERDPLEFSYDIPAVIQPQSMHQIDYGGGQFVIITPHPQSEPPPSPGHYFDVNQHTIITTTTLPVADIFEDYQFNRERYILNTEALCDHCGTRSRNLHYCEYCKCRISDNAKLLSISQSNLENGNVEPQKLSANCSNRCTPRTEKNNKHKAKSDIPTPKITRQRKMLEKRRNKRERKRKALEKEIKMLLDHGDNKECIVISSSEDDDLPNANKGADAHTPLSEPLINKINKPIRIDDDDDKCILIPSSPDEDSSNTGDEKTVPPKPLPLKQITKPPRLPTNSVILECVSIRIGSYECVSPSKAPLFAVTFSGRGIAFDVLHSQTSHEPIRIRIPNDSILLVESHEDDPLPVIFVTTGTIFTQSIRKMLGFSSDSKDSEYHYDPVNGNRRQKRIAFILTRILKQAALIRRFFPLGTIHGISHVNAFNILNDVPTYDIT